MSIHIFQCLLDPGKGIGFEYKTCHINITIYKINNSWIAFTNKKSKAGRKKS